MPRWRERFAPAMVERMNQLERSLATGKFCFTAEVVPPLSAAPDQLLEQAALLKGRVEAVNVTDGAAARTTMSSCAAAALLALNGVEPVLQLTCRDRNRIALCADLTGAAAFGVCNLLLLSGDSPAHGDQPEATAVHDLDSATLTRFARDMSTGGVLPSGRNIDPPPRFHIGAADVPQFLNKQDGAPVVAGKIELGARFVQTQLCYDLKLIRAYIAALGEWGVLDQAKILIGLGPVASARSAKWMRDNLWGVAIPDAMLQRLEDSADPKQEGRRLCLELIEALQKIDGVAGAHLMAPGQSAAAIAALLSELTSV